MTLARKMILSAKENGAGLVKSQLYNAEDDKGKANYKLIKKAELTFEQAKGLFDYGASIGIEVFFSVFGVEYVAWCERIGVKRYKIACQYRDKETLRAVQETGKPVFISIYPPILQTNMPEIKNWNHLYCVPDYPAALKDLDLNNIGFSYVFNGFSDHSIGLDVAKIAIARGAKIIEKHFVLDRNSPAPDAPWSMEPQELDELVRWEKVVAECL